MKKIVQTDKAPLAVGSYSQAVIYKDLIFFSGQIPLNTKGEMLEGDVKKQTAQVMENIGAILKENSLNYSHILKASIFLTDINDFKQVDEVYSSYFEKNYPARSCVAVKSLPKEAQVEIEVIAFLNQK